MRGYRTSGVYDVRPVPSADWSSVYCDMKGGRGLTVLQRRETGDVTFARNWKDYKFGFGSLYGEFWIGNKVWTQIITFVNRFSPFSSLFIGCYM